MNIHTPEKMLPVKRGELRNGIIYLADCMLLSQRDKVKNKRGQVLGQAGTGCRRQAGQCPGEAPKHKVDEMIRECHLGILIPVM